MTDNIVNLDVETTQRVAPEKVLGNAPAMESVVVIGDTAEGEFWFATSQPDAQDILWLLERARTKLLGILDD